MRFKRLKRRTEILKGQLDMAPLIASAPGPPSLKASCRPATSRVARPADLASLLASSAALMAPLIQPAKDPTLRPVSRPLNAERALFFICVRP